MTPKIRVFLADDHDVVRRGLQALIESEDDMEVVGMAKNGAEAVQRAAIYQPDVILLDMKMPLKNGLEALVEIMAQRPDSRVMMLTSFSDDATLFAAIKAGALGYLLKEAQGSELVRAIRNTYEGKSALSPDIALKVIQEINKPPKPEAPMTDEPLTEREEEILRHVARGLSNQEIADLLVVSERTVRTHISNILGKLHLANRTQATLYALREGIADLNE
ncbi:MAG: response regulator transcription factor [Chloroflexi bacterium]|nr:response regulator transcription factor [Chloroflexota bacterium]MBP7042077.1 response regulator transcription factor [Chloroflexota bacterium]